MKSLLFIKNNKKVISYILIALILIRFLYLNYINWKYGALTTGVPGVQYWLDSDRYLFGADNLLNSLPVESRGGQYLGYIVFIAFFQLLGFSIEIIPIIQICIALLAAYLLYNLTKSITGSRLSGIVSFGLYLLNPFITTWHLFILTESLYSSFVILACWSIYKVHLNPSIKNYILCSIILIATIFIRPNGWIFIPIACCFFIFYSKKLILKIRVSLISLTLLLFIIGAASIPAFNKSIEATTPYELMIKGEVIWDHPSERIKMPEDLSYKNSNWSNGFFYIIHHPISCIKLASLRIGKMFIQIREHHSFKYKAHILLWILPAYLLALIGIFYCKKRSITFLITSIIIGHSIIVGLTYATHESRFIIYILPIIYVLSGCGFSILFKNILRYLKMTENHMKIT